MGRVARSQCTVAAAAISFLARTRLKGPYGLMCGLPQPLVASQSMICGEGAVTTSLAAASLALTGRSRGRGARRAPDPRTQRERFYYTKRRQDRPFRPPIHAGSAAAPTSI